jgi:hypothetical protein
MDDIPRLYQYAGGHAKSSLDNYGSMSGAYTCNARVRTVVKRKRRWGSTMDDRLKFIPAKPFVLSEVDILSILRRNFFVSW